MKILNGSFIIIVLAAAFSGNLSAGSAGGHVLTLAPDARSAAMGESVTAVCDDAGTVFYNPAGLALIEHTEVLCSQNRWFEGVEHQYAGIVYSLRDVRTANINDLGTIAFSMALLDYGEITGRDASGMANGQFSPRDRMMSFGYAKTVYARDDTGTLSLGAQGVFITEEITDDNRNNTAFDAGLVWEAPLIPVKVGVAYLHGGQDLEYSSDRYKLPSAVRTGISYSFKGLLLDTDVNMGTDNKTTYHAGGEYRMFDALMARAGYKTGVDAENALSLGAGIRIKDLDIAFFYAREMEISYAFIPYGDLGDTHRLSLLLKLGAD